MIGRKSWQREASSERRSYPDKDTACSKRRAVPSNNKVRIIGSSEVTQATNHLCKSHPETNTQERIKHRNLMIMRTWCRTLKKIYKKINRSPTQTKLTELTSGIQFFKPVNSAICRATNYSFRTI